MNYWSIKLRIPLIAAASIGVLASAAYSKVASAPVWSSSESTVIAAWPARKHTGKLDPVREARIARIVRGMTLEQKIGQMTQPDIRWITPDQVRQYYIGTVLNGGGAWPPYRSRGRRPSGGESAVTDTRPTVPDP